MSQSPVTAVSLWWASTDSDLERIALDDAASVSPDGVLIRHDRLARCGVVTILPIAPRDLVIAAALVNAAASRVWVALNGCPVGDGLLPLRHADQLAIAGTTFWISAESAAVRTHYRAAEHGPQVRCALTKSRLEEGQEMVICPGVPGTPCGRVYAAAAWETVVERNPLMKCMQCGYRPGRPAWRPPDPVARKDLIHGLRPFTHRG